MSRPKSSGPRKSTPPGGRWADSEAATFREIAVLWRNLTTSCVLLGDGVMYRVIVLSDDEVVRQETMMDEGAALEKGWKWQRGYRR